MILPPGHAQAVQARRRLTSREKWILSGVLGTVAAVLAAVVIALASSGHTSGNGCVYVTYAGIIGAQQLDACGASARTVCRDLGTSRGFTGPAVPQVAAACRKAGLPVGS
ncbi:MAG: hypothetical protein JO372_05615 [Solirubrobacterales bacterium]|nr:hypothetical protein [Solirubrobacterales bacterium]